MNKKAILKDNNKTGITQIATPNNSDNHKWKEKLQFQIIQVK